MDKRKSDDIKRLITVLAFIIIIIILVIVLILITHRKSGTSPTNNNAVNNTNNNTSADTNNEINNIQNTNVSNGTNNNIKNNNSGGYLEEVADLESYFWLKDRLSLYYSSNDLEDPTMLMDKDVINELGVTVDNYRKFNDFDAPIFRIDKIYEQILNKNRSLYVVKLRYGKSEEDAKDSIVWVEKDTSSNTFSIYPYEYLKMKNYLDFKEGDTVPVDSSKIIEKNAENKYSEDDDDIDEDTELCMKGLFERYKFDLLVDREHLYSILEIDYKNAKYSNLEDLKKYINDNRTDLYLDMISEYKVVNYNEYVEYRAICNSQRNYVFNAKNMMDYTVSLDNYSVVQNKDTYNAFLPAAQAKYCVDRVVQALNYKDYDFVYSKLNPVQKNNYYKNVNEFKNYLSKALYEQNSYEIDDNYLIISDNVYQFTVTIRDATGGEFTYSKFTMAVTLKDDADFIISIVNSDN